MSQIHEMANNCSKGDVVEVPGKQGTVKLAYFIKQGVKFTQVALLSNNDNTDFYNVVSVENWRYPGETSWH